jgi:hypothetical protein
MPGIFKITCTHCPFAAEECASSTWVAVRDGTQEPCPHPLERTIAQERTGESWEALVRAGRVHYRYAFLCRDCGAVEHHEVPGRASRGHIASIVYHPREADALAVPCARCQARRLVAIVGPPLGLLFWVPLTIATISVFGAIGACGKGIIDLAIDGSGFSLWTAAALLGLAIPAGLLVRLAHRRHAVRARVACPRCRAGTLRMQMVARR